jgi:hypothetical protein
MLEHAEDGMSGCAVDAESTAELRHQERLVGMGCEEVEQIDRPVHRGCWTPWTHMV